MCRGPVCRGDSPIFVSFARNTNTNRAANSFGSTRYNGGYAPQQGWMKIMGHYSAPLHLVSAGNERVLAIMGLGLGIEAGIEGRVNTAPVCSLRCRQ